MNNISRALLVSRVGTVGQNPVRTLEVSGDDALEREPICRGLVLASRSRAGDVGGRRVELLEERRRATTGEHHSAQHRVYVRCGCVGDAIRVCTVHRAALAAANVPRCRLRGRGRQARRAHVRRVVVALAEKALNGGEGESREAHPARARPARRSPLDWPEPSPRARASYPATVDVRGAATALGRAHMCVCGTSLAGRERARVARCAAAGTRVEA